MFRAFFLNRRWFAWSIAGTGLILFATWYKVELDVAINEWFGDFYNLIQKALGQAHSVTMAEYGEKLFTFGRIAGLYILIAVVLDFFIKHYIFRWRTAMNDYYMANWHKVRHIEGAAQRVQEDTMRFARIMEGLGVSLMRSLMTLAAFLPILWTLSGHVTELPWIGPVEHSLVFVALMSAIFGTVLLATVGIKLPGLEFENQKVEAAYRKELVLGEDRLLGIRAQSFEFVMEPGQRLAGAQRAVAKPEQQLGGEGALAGGAAGAVGDGEEGRLQRRQPVAGGAQFFGTFGGGRREEFDRDFGVVHGVFG